ncbi:MAG: iron-containing alcohol dehydrogenase [Phycisphaerae bacterium]
MADAMTMTLETPVGIYLPRLLAFGPGMAERVATDGIVGAAGTRVLVVADPAIDASAIETTMEGKGLQAVRLEAPRREPHMADVRVAAAIAREHRIEAVVGIGGGSAMDLAKLVAVLGTADCTVDIRAIAGIDKVAGRVLPLVCVPTTAGTGSEVSPNAIVLDEAENLKVGVISRHLVPDAAYLDPLLTLSVPRGVTASTGIDALTHCIEAYTSKFAHPMIDLYAIEGIRLIARNLLRVMENPEDVAGRSALLLGALYGGMCLGPVNTGAVHALAYPLGSVYQVAHGISNAVMLAAVMEFNMSATPERYAEVAVAMGASRGATAEETARNGIEMIRHFMERCGVPRTLTALEVPADAVPAMAAGAMKVTRLLDRNIRPVTYEDAVAIYRKVLA